MVCFGGGVVFFCEDGECFVVGIECVDFGFKRHVSFGIWFGC